MDVWLSVMTGIGAGLIAALIPFISSHKKNKLDYIEAERKDWRYHIRELAKQLHNTTNTKELMSCIEQLKLRLNAYGSCDEADIFRDGHIWALLEQIEKDLEEDNLSRLHSQKKRLNYYLSCLIKHNWERSKKEIKGEGFLIGNYVMIPIALLIDFLICQPMVSSLSSINIFAITFVFYAMLFIGIYRTKNLFYKSTIIIESEGALTYKKTGIIPMLIWVLMNSVILTIYSYNLFYGLAREENISYAMQSAAAGSVIIKVIVVIMTVIFLQYTQSIHDSLCQKYINTLNCIRIKEGIESGRYTQSSQPPHIAEATQKRE